MALYTKKKGQYIALTREQMRRMRRVDYVYRVDRTATRLEAASRALAMWLSDIEPEWLDKLKLPDAAQLRQMCDEAREALVELRRV